MDPRVQMLHGFLARPTQAEPRAETAREVKSLAVPAGFRCPLHPVWEVGVFVAWEVLSRSGYLLRTTALLFGVYIGALFLETPT